MEMLKIGEKTYSVIRSQTALRRSYSLESSKGFPWRTYAGWDRICGGGIISQASYSKTDSNGRRFLFSVGPWWLDANHSHPGFGSLSLIFFAFVRQIPECVGSIVLDPTLLYPNMRGMKIRAKIRGYDVDLKGADLVFWFQCYSRKIGKRVNYACIGQPLNDRLIDGNINDFEMKIDIGTTDDWVCLGSCDEKIDLYGNLDLQELDLDTPDDMGFVLVPIEARPLWADECNVASQMDLGPNGTWPIDISSLPTGAIAMYELEIDYYSDYEIIALG